MKIKTIHYYMVWQGKAGWGGFENYRSALCEAIRYKMRDPSRKVHIVEVITKERKVKTI